MMLCWVCTVVRDSKVWVLDRRVFQRIMMRTGLQRLEDNVNFLRSVPLFRNLPSDVLARISDVLEVVCLHSLILNNSGTKLRTKRL